jgi:hypothetical protein
MIDGITPAAALPPARSAYQPESVTPFVQAVPDVKSESKFWEYVPVVVRTIPWAWAAADQSPRNPPKNAYNAVRESLMS